MHRKSVNNDLEEWNMGITIDLHITVPGIITAVGILLALIFFVCGIIFDSERAMRAALITLAITLIVLGMVSTEEIKTARWTTGKGCVGYTTGAISYPQYYRIR